MQALETFRNEGKQIIYVDVAYNIQHTPLPHVESGRYIWVWKGRRLIIAHAGRKLELVPVTLLILSRRHKTGMAVAK